MVFFRRLRMRWRARRFERKLRDDGVLPARSRQHLWRVRRSNEQRSQLLVGPLRSSWLRFFCFARAAPPAQQLAPLDPPFAATCTEGTTDISRRRPPPSSSVLVDSEVKEHAAECVLQASEAGSRALGGDLEPEPDVDERSGQAANDRIHSAAARNTSTDEVALAIRGTKLDAETILVRNRELLAQYRAALDAVLASNVTTSPNIDLFKENECLKQQIVRLQRELERAREVSLVSASITDSRIAYRGGRQVVEYKLRLDTDSRGTLFVWHRYSTFCNLVTTLQTKNGYKPGEIPELPRKQLFGNYSEKTIQERVAKLNEFLAAATKSEHLQWGVRVDPDTCVYKRRVKKASSSSQSQSRLPPPPPSVEPESTVASTEEGDLVSENECLKKQVESLRNKLLRSKEVALVSAKVVDSRLSWREGRQFVEYKLQIETNTRGTLFVWHRYSTFRKLAAILQEKNGYKREDFPELPNKQLFGTYSDKTIQERVSTLNEFLEAATKAEELQWGIRVDPDTCVYKRRAKKASTASTASTSSASSSHLPRQSALSRLWFRHFAKRGRNSRS